MRIDGIQLAQGSNISNLVVASGTSFPSQADEGELFYRSDSDARVGGLYLFALGTWNRIASTSSLTLPNGVQLPAFANEGDVFYLNSNTASEGLYVYKNGVWTNTTAGSAPTFDVTGDVTGLLDGGTDVLTLSSVGVLPGSYGSGAQTITLTVDAKGRVTSVAAITATPAFASVTGKPTTLAGYGITDAQPLDADLTAVGGLTTTGLVTRTGAGTADTRSIAVSGAGLSVTNADGVAGNPTIASNATAANTASTLVLRDGSGNFTAGTVTAALTGAASLNVLKSGDTMASGANITFTGGGRVTGVANPVNATDVVNKQYLEQQVSESIPAGQVGQVPFISVDGTRTTELGYTLVKGQFVESDTELTDAYTRITSNETIFSEWTRFSHTVSTGGILTRTGGVSRFQFTSTNLSTAAASFPVGKSVQVFSSANTSFSGTFTITAVSSAGLSHVIFYSQAAEANVSTSVVGSLQLNNEQPAFSGELSAWSYDTVNDVISCTANTDSYVGFISLQRYADYEHEVVLRSTNTDDNIIGVVLAWAVDNSGREFTLSALRSTGGSGFTWRVVYNFGRSEVVTVQDRTIDVKWGNGAYGASAVAAGYISNATLGGWDDFPAGTRVKVVRTGDTITVQTSDLGETTYVPNSTITIDLTSAAYLEKFRGPREIGYSASSQAAASFEVIAFSDSLNVIYDVRDGDVYEYNGTAWVLQGSKNLVEEVGYGRVLFNPYTNKTYYTSFDDQGVIKIGETGSDRVRRTGDTITGPIVISTNTASTALRVTQTGTGDAIRIEDFVNPDSTPFVVDSLGRVLIGADTTEFEAGLQVHGTANAVNFNQTFYGNNASGPGNGFSKSRGTVVGANAMVQSGDALGQVNFQGADGSGYVVSAAILSQVDGSPSAGLIPSNLIFSTSDVGGSITERFRIAGTGAFGLSGGNYGTVGQVLTSAGSTSTPTWSTPTTGTVTSVAVSPSGIGLSVSGSPITSSGTITITSNATSVNTGSTIVARDSVGSFSANVANLSNWTVTNGIPVITATTAQFEFREGDQTLPAGRWRFTLDGDQLSLRHNTAVAGDFTTYVAAWAGNSDNSVSLGAGVVSTSTTTGTLRVSGGAGITGAVHATSFTGSGAALTALNATQLTTGTIPDARIASTGVTQHQAALTILESQITDGTLLTRNAGNETISGTWTFNNALTVGTPTLDGHATTKQYVDNLVTGLDMKQSVHAATTANITLSGTQTVDGIALIVGDRVLVKNQTTASQNGIYVVAAGAWTRAADADNVPGNEVTGGMYTFVEEGTTNSDTGWVLATDDPITLGTTALTFVQFTGLGSINAGAGLTKTGSTIDIVSASAARIVVNADSIDLAATAISPGTYNSLTVDTYGRATAGTNSITGTGTTYVTNTNPTISGATLNGTTTVSNVSIRSWTVADTDIDGLTNGSTSGTLIEGPNSSHLTFGLRSNDINDGFQILGKGAATTPATDPYINLAFEVKTTGDTTVGGTLAVAGATTMAAPLTIVDVNDQLVLQRTVNQRLVIENNGTSVNPFITSYSATDNAKTIEFRSTTTEANAPLTAGLVGFNFLTYSTNMFSITTTGITWTGTATGNGSGITNLNGSSLATGTVADARLSSNVALRNNINNFSVTQNTVIAVAGANQEYIRFTPTDFGAGKPYFAVKTTGATDRFQMLLWDGTGSTGTISIGASNVELGTGSANVYSTGSLAAVTTVSAGTQFLALASDLVTQPGYSWTGDINTGMWRPGPDTISLATNGVDRFRVSSTGNIGVDIVPTYRKMEVRVGDYTGNLTPNGYALRAGVADGTGAGWLAGLFMESDSDGNVSVSLYSPNSITAGANTSSKGIEFFGSGAGQAFRLHTGGGVERLRVEPSGAVGFGGANFGTAGQVLTSNGSGGVPTWQALSFSTGLFADGSAAAPSVSFSADSNTGVYRVAADTIGITTGGTEAVRINSTGAVGFGGANFGTAGQVLTSNGTGAVPTWSSTPTVSGVTYGSIAASGTATLTTSTTAANQVVDSIAAATFRSVKYQVQITSGSTFAMTEISVVHNGTGTFMTEYGTISTGTNLALFDSDISGGNLRLLVMPTNAVTTIKVIRSAITV